MKKAILAVLIGGIAAWASADICDVVIVPYFWRDNPNSVFTSAKDLPSVRLSDSHLSGLPIGYANQHRWIVSEDGLTQKQFQINDFFELSAEFVLQGNPPRPPREEGGIIVDSPAGDGKFMIASDGEVACFSGPFTFYSFSQEYGINYRVGDPITLKLEYFLDPNDNRRKLRYEVTYRGTTYTSPAFRIFTNEQGIPGPYVAGAYLQVEIGRDAPNAATLESHNIRWNRRLLIAGDVDCNGCENDRDLSRILVAFGQTGNPPEDVNKDGIVDQNDLQIGLAKFALGCQ